MKRLLLQLLLVAIALPFSACEDNGNGKEEETPYYNDAQSSTWFYKGEVEVIQTDNSVFRKDGLVMKLVFNEYRNVCNLVMYDAQFASAMPLFDITVSGMNATASGTGYRLTGENIIPTYGSGNEMPIYTITGLVINADTGTMEFEMMCGTFPVKYSGKGYQAGKDEFGDEGVDFVFVSDGSYSGQYIAYLTAGGTNELEDIIAEISFSEDMKSCSVMLQQIKFSTSPYEPYMDLIFPGIECTPAGTGYKLSADLLYPIWNQEEVTNNPVTKVSGLVTDTILELEMVVGSTPVSYKGTVTE